MVAICYGMEHQWKTLATFSRKGSKTSPVYEEEEYISRIQQKPGRDFLLRGLALDTRLIIGFQS